MTKASIPDLPQKSRAGRRTGDPDVLTYSIIYEKTGVTVGQQPGQIACSTRPRRSQPFFSDGNFTFTSSRTFGGPNEIRCADRRVVVRAFVVRDSLRTQQICPRAHTTKHRRPYSTGPGGMRASTLGISRVGWTILRVVLGLAGPIRTVLSAAHISVIAGSFRRGWFLVLRRTSGAAAPMAKPCMRGSLIRRASISIGAVRFAVLSASR